MRLEPYLKPGQFVFLRGTATRDDALRSLAKAAGAALEGVSAEHLHACLIEREGQRPTSTPEGVAFPHVLLPEISATIIVPASVRPGVSFGVADHPAVDLIFGMFGSSAKPWEHVRLLARLARIVRADGAMNRLRTAESAQELYERLVEEDRSHG